MGVCVKRGVIACLLVVALGPAAVACRAQDRQAEPPKPVFPQLFPHPTGRNGYEEIVMAADLAVAAASRKDLWMPGVTLSEMRAAMKDPDNVRAIALLGAGLKKPIQSPRTTLTYSTTLPDLAGMRALGRLLARDMHVRFADGRNIEAIADLRDGLSLATVLHGETLIGSLVAIAIDAIVVTEFARHLDYLSARDCDRALDVIKAWRRLPDPTTLALESERRLILANLQAMKSDPRPLRELLSASLESEDPNGPDAQARATLRALLQDPAGLSRTLDQVAIRTNGYFARAYAEIRKPAWERQPISVVEDQTPAGKIAGMLLPALTMAADKFVSADARVRLLGVHIVLRRFLWEFGKLPASLDELAVGSLAVDPYSGKPILYKRLTDRTYELSSIGSEGPEGRKAITLPPVPMTP